MTQTTLNTSSEKTTHSMSFDFNMNSELPFSCPKCPEKTYKFFMGLANHYIRKHFKEQVLK
jgi:hypothetical protein